MKRKPWLYMGFLVLPADLNGSGIRWTCNCGLAFTLKADTKAGMRELIRHYRKGRAMTHETKHTLFTLDPCPDAQQFYTIRPFDGSPEGDTDKQPIATIYDFEQAAFIVRACNAHYDLVAKLEHCLCYMDADSDDQQEQKDYAETLAVLAKAKGQP